MSIARARFAGVRLLALAVGWAGLLGTATAIPGQSEAAPLLASVASQSVASGSPNALNPSHLVELGAMIFSDKRLSADGSVSCASCHVEALAFSDGRRVSVGVNGLRGTRNAPTLLNVGEHETFFWDGRRATLEAQVIDPFINEREHGLSGVEELLSRLRGMPEYRSAFAKSFGVDAPTEDGVAAALAAFVRSMPRTASRFDRWLGGDSRALSPQERQGFEIFRGAGQCASCHALADGRPAFTDNQFHSIGIGAVDLANMVVEAARLVIGVSPDTVARLIVAEPAIAALGRFNVTLKPADIGKYRTPSLRNVALTAPYMHDGSIPSLEVAVDQEIYYRGTQQGRPLALSAEDKASLVAFLRSLTSESLERAKGSP